VARCRGWMERQSSLLDEFFLFSRRSFKNGRLACKSARATWSLGFISIAFFHPRTRSHPCHSPRPVRVTFTHIYSPVSGNLDSTFDRSHLCSARDLFASLPWNSFIDIYMRIYISFAFSII